MCVLIDQRNLLTIITCMYPTILQLFSLNSTDNNINQFDKKEINGLRFYRVSSPPLHTSQCLMLNEQTL